MKRLCLLAAAMAMVFTMSLPTATAEMFNGPYIGVNLGYGSTEHEVGDIFFGTGAQDSLNGSGFNGGLFAGYGATSDAGVYFGIEAEGSMSTGEYESGSAVLGVRAEISQDWSAGLSARLGGMITDTMLGYVRAGWVATRYKYTEISPFGAWSQNETFSGPRLGGGIEFAINKDVSFRVDYTYTWYESKDLQDAGVPILSIKPSEQLFRIGLAYNF